MTTSPTGDPTGDPTAAPTPIDLTLRDGRLLRSYDVGAEASDAPVLLWHHGSPQTGAPLDPVREAAEARGIRLVTYARPSYGGSTALHGRDVASAAWDVAQLLDALGIDRFATMGASGGAPHALACAALMPDRVSSVVMFAGIAPYPGAEAAGGVVASSEADAGGFDFFDGIVAPGGLRAALEGRDARIRFAEVDDFDPACFVDRDYAALEGEWASLDVDVQRSAEWGDDGLIDDDLAFVSPWGFELADVAAPVLVVQGESDRIDPASHARWMHSRLPNSELWMRVDDGHVSILREVPASMDWVRF